MKLSGISFILLLALPFSAWSQAIDMPDTIQGAETVDAAKLIKIARHTR